MSSEDRERQLLDSGLELFKQRPYEEVSIEEIAAFAGVSTGLLYRYFPTKRDLILAILRREQSHFFEQIAPDLSLDPLQRFLSGLDAFIDYVEERADVFTTVFALRGGDPEITALYESGRARQIENLLEGLREWPDSPLRAEGDPRLLVALQGWVYFVDGAVARWLAEDSVPREDLKTLLTASFAGVIEAARLSGAPPRA